MPRDVLASLSSASRAHACVGSVAMPRVGYIRDDADQGSAVHEALAVLVPEGRAEMGERLPAIFERWGIGEDVAGMLRAQLAAFNPPIPKADDGEEVTPALCEVALCMRSDGSVVEVEGARGRYDMPEGGVLPGSIDCMWAEGDGGPLRVDRCSLCEGDGDSRKGLCYGGRADPCEACLGAGRRVVCPLGSTLWIVDFKTGDDAHVPLESRNRQIAWGAALAARWTGAEKVVAALCFVEGTEGRWVYRTAPPAWPGAPRAPRPYDREELDAIVAEILGDGARWQEQTRRRAAGESLDLVAGGHCEFCPARHGCPAHVAEPRALLALADERLATGPVSDEEAARWADALPRLRRAVDGVEGALKARVQATGRPIELPDGRVWGPRPTSSRSFITRPTYETLLAYIVELVGEAAASEIADGAFSTSRASLERAVGVACERADIQRGTMVEAAVKRRLFAKLKDAGAISEVAGVQWRAHHPLLFRALEEQDEAAEERKARR